MRQIALPIYSPQLAGLTKIAGKLQIAFNKSRGESGHVSLADGYLTQYDPNQYPDIEALINRGLRGVFAPLPKFIMDGFEFGNLRTSHTRDREYPNARRDEMFVVLLQNGEVFIVLRSWNDAVLPVDELQCSHDEFANFYMTGIMREVNGTSVVSFIFNMVDL